VRFAGGDSSVIVRRIDPVDAGRSRFAVELMVVHPVLKRQLLGALSVPDGGHMGSTSFGAATPGTGAAEAPPVFDALADTDAAAADRDRPEAAPDVAEAPLKAPMTSAADADEVRDLVDELRRFMDD
jgi:hypothetical protein